jgi:hypothetical protein
MKSSRIVSHVRACRPRGGTYLLLVFGLLGGLSLAATGQEPIATGVLDRDPQLVGWWKFDETTGAVAADSSRHEHAGQLSGDMTFEQNSIPGAVGRALRFAGGDDLVRVTGYTGVTGTQARTISAWIKTEATQGELVSWGKGEFGQMWTCAFIRGHIGVTPHGGYYYMADNVHDNAWHHVVAVVREAELPNLHDDVALYLDGKAVDPDPIGLLDLWPIETGDDAPVTIGKQFQGGIDDLRIYARALSEEEIQTLCRLAK